MCFETLHSDLMLFCLNTLPGLNAKAAGPQPLNSRSHHSFVFEPSVISWYQQIVIPSGTPVKSLLWPKSLLSCSLLTVQTSCRLCPLAGDPSEICECNKLPFRFHPHFFLWPYQLPHASSYIYMLSTENPRMKSAPPFMPVLSDDSSGEQGHLQSSLLHSRSLLQEVPAQDNLLSQQQSRQDS